MESTEDLRRKRLEKLMEQQYRSQVQSQIQQDREEAAVQQQVEALEEIVKARLSRDALLRYGNLKTGHPEKALQLLVVLGRAINSGQIKEAISDEQLKSLLKRIVDAESQPHSGSRKIRKD